MIDIAEKAFLATVAVATLSKDSFGANYRQIILGRQRRSQAAIEYKDTQPPTPYRLILQ